MASEDNKDLAQRTAQRSTNEIDKYKVPDAMALQPMVTSFSCTAAYPKAYASKRSGQVVCGSPTRRPSLKGPNPFEQARLASMAHASAPQESPQRRMP